MRVFISFYFADIPHTKSRGWGVWDPPNHASPRVGPRPGHPGCAPALSRPQRPFALPGQWVHTPVPPSEPGPPVHHHLKKPRGTRQRASQQWVTHGRQQIDCLGVFFFLSSVLLLVKIWDSCSAFWGDAWIVFPSAVWTPIPDQSPVLARGTGLVDSHVGKRPSPQDLSDWKGCFKSQVHWFGSRPCSPALGLAERWTWVARLPRRAFRNGSPYHVPRSSAFSGFITSRLGYTICSSLKRDNPTAVQRKGKRIIAANQQREIQIRLLWEIYLIVLFIVINMD